MTTTNVFQGMDSDAKNSSRVLRPPGGGSSNIFGTPEPPPPCEPLPTTNNVSPAGAPTPLKPESKGKIDTDRLFGGGQSTEVKIRSGGNQKNQGCMNPITGRWSDSSLADPMSTPERASKKKVVNPRTGLAADQTAPSPQPSTPERLTKKRGYYHPEGFNPITGEPITESAPKTNDHKSVSQNGESNNNGGTYDPLTGKDLTEPKEQVSVLPPREMKVPHTSTRVRQPPGGASSGLW